MTGGQPSVDNIYLIKGQPLPSGTGLTNPVPIKSTDGSTNATLYVIGAEDAVYQGAINIEPGANATVPGGVGEGITIRTIAGTAAGTVATAVDIGANAQGANHLYISGLSGSSEVYDEVYNPAIKSAAIVNVETSLNSAAPATAQRQFTFTAPKTGAYMLQVDINYFNINTTPTISVPVFSGVDQVGLFNEPGGAIEWTLTTLPPQAAGEVPFMSSTIAATSLIKQAQLLSVAEPMDFTVSNMGFLTAGSDYNINLYAIKPNPAVSPAVAGDWNLSDIRVRLIQMC
jgi:hypothetical protein